MYRNIARLKEREIDGARFAARDRSSSGANRCLQDRAFDLGWPNKTFRVYDIPLSCRRTNMAKKSKLNQVAVRIGAAMGRADRKAHQVAQAGVLAKKELRAISKQVDVLKRQLQKTTKRLRNALS